MFCSKCGAPVPDNETVCPGCGNPVEQATQPDASPKAKAFDSKNPLLVLVTMALSLLLIVLSINGAMTQPFYDIPVLSALLNVSGEKDEAVAELLDSLDDSIDYMEDSMDYAEDILDDDELEALEAAIASAETLHAKFSIKNFKTYVNLAEQIDEEFNAGMDEGEINEMQGILNILTTVIYVFFVLPLLFCLLGGLKKSAGLTVTAIVFTMLSQLIFSGIIWAVLTLVVGIVQVKLCKMVNPKKKKHQAATA